MKDRRLSLDERIEIACGEGLWRTYSDSYSCKDLDYWKVPKTFNDLDKKQREILAQYWHTLNY